jgi:hypothetical protein
MGFLVPNGAEKETTVYLLTRLFVVNGFDAMGLLGQAGLGGREKDRVESSLMGMTQRFMVAEA